MTSRINSAAVDSASRPPRKGKRLRNFGPEGPYVCVPMVFFRKPENLSPTERLIAFEMGRACNFAYLRGQDWFPFTFGNLEYVCDDKTFRTSTEKICASGLFERKPTDPAKHNSPYLYRYIEDWQSRLPDRKATKKANRKGARLDRDRDRKRVYEESSGRNSRTSAALPSGQKAPISGRNSWDLNFNNFEDPDNYSTSDDQKIVDAFLKQYRLRGGTAEISKDFIEGIVHGGRLNAARYRAEAQEANDESLQFR